MFAANILEFSLNKERKTKNLSIPLTIELSKVYVKPSGCKDICDLKF